MSLLFTNSFSDIGVILEFDEKNFSPSEVKRTDVIGLTQSKSPEKYL